MFIVALFMTAMIEIPEHWLMDKHIKKIPYVQTMNYTAFKKDMLAYVTTYGRGGVTRTVFILWS